MKKIFIISTILLLFALILWGIYVLAFREKTPDNITLQEETFGNVEVGDTTVTDTPDITPLTEVGVITATPTLAGTGIRYITEGGHAVSMTERGTNQLELFTLDTPPITNAFWSQYYDDVIVHTRDGVYTYNDTLKDTIKLKDTVDYALWSNISGKILYKYFDKSTKQRSLNISNARGADWRELVTLPYRRVSFVQIPQSSHIALWQDGDSFIQTRLETVSSLSATAPTLIYEGLYGADFLYSPNGQKILVSSTKNKGGSEIILATLNENGGQYTNLQTPTLVEKAVWSKDNKTVYYAQPSDIPGGSVMPNDYKNNRFTTRDTFWKIDIETGEKSRLIALEDVVEKFDATQLFLSQTEDALFFINKVNGLLYRLDIVH